MLTVFTPVPDHILESILQVGLNIIINWKLASIHDSHVHTVLNGMVEEDGVEGLTKIVKSAEGEGQI